MKIICRIFGHKWQIVGVQPDPDSRLLPFNILYGCERCTHTAWDAVPEVRRA